MGILRDVLCDLPDADVELEAYGRSGKCECRIDGRRLLDAIQAHRRMFRGAGPDGRRVLALLFKSEETIEFLVAALAAMAEGWTVVPLFPNWPGDIQRLYLQTYRLRALATAKGFEARAREWRDELIDLHVNIDLRIDFNSLAESPATGNDAGGVEPDSLFRDIPLDHSAAWIFTSGTSGNLAKLTEITLENLESAMANIVNVDFLGKGMTFHSPLSASHIFAFSCILGLLAARPRRIIFSDVQYLQRLPESRTGKVDGVILVPLVINRLRASFYEKLTSDLNPKTAPPELKRLARLPLKSRQWLKRLVKKAEEAVMELEVAGSTRVRWRAAIRVTRSLFGRVLRCRLGSPNFVVIGGAKPNLSAMAFLEVMGIRCLQGWGMTETTGPLAVCALGDRRKGAFGTCGAVFPGTRAYVEDGELIVEGPQIARGYHDPSGEFVPFNGKKRTGDYAEFDDSGRLKVLGKASDRITTGNGLNYNPIPIEEAVGALDLERQHAIEEAVVIGDGQPRLGVVFFLRDGVGGAATRNYLAELLRDFNAGRSIDERIEEWTISPEPFRDAGCLGPSGKLVRRRVEERFAVMFERKDPVRAG